MRRREACFLHWLAAMSKQRVVAMGFVLGLASLLGACGAVVDEPATEVEDVDLQEETLEMARPPVRIRRFNPIDPGGRLLQCLQDPRKKYVARDPRICAGIRFYCEEGIPFFDACGCGCAVGIPE